ncbi:hypothetical protein [Allosphingosinicella deserti]|uniref:Uncharacterized protein n=1 Tax=Allosphingosinicella deserti TaxID=2116704 RepID=A0A2P7QEH5_9SPHN|nr:hypothetical protein [Sphingomonas deserti]PSJ36371.1 hypothetical protein C7I55_26365 [Sphingomonas deserti]
MQSAYDQGLLRGRKLLAAKRLVEARRRRGKRLKSVEPYAPEKLNSAALVRAYQDDAQRKREIIRRVNSAKDRLVLITEALRRLAADAAFAALIKEEGLDTMPQKIADRVSSVQAA